VGKQGWPEGSGLGIVKDPDEHSIAIPTSRAGNGSSRFTEVDMRITKRLSIEFQHREVTISIAASTFHVQDHEPDAADASTVCRTCGSPWIVVDAGSVGDVPANVDRIHHALQQSGLHVQVSSSGHLQICQKSFEEIKEKL